MLPYKPSRDDLVSKALDDGEHTRSHRLEVSQLKSFKNWLNHHIAPCGMHVEDVRADLMDGTALCTLVTRLYPTPPIGRWWRKPRLDIQRMENIAIALRCLRSHGVRLENIDAKDIYDGNVKLILGMLWSTIVKNQISDIEVEDPRTKKTKTANEALLAWVRQCVEGYPGVEPPQDLSAATLKDGKALAALVGKNAEDVGRSVLPKDAIAKEDPRALVTRALDAATDVFNAPKLIDADDLVAGDVDDNSIELYLSSLYHAVDAEKKRQEEEKKAKDEEEAERRRREQMKDAERRRAEEEERERKRREEEEQKRRREEEERKRQQEEAEAAAAAQKLPDWVNNSIVLEGTWRGDTAGGSCEFSTFRCNPTFEATVTKKTHVHISLSQGEKPLKPMALHVVKRANPFDFSIPLHGEGIVQETAYAQRVEVACDVDLVPNEHPYIIIPSLKERGMESTFTVTIHTDGPIHVCPTQPPAHFKKTVLRGEWKGKTAGGMHDLPTWRLNPQYRIRIAKPSKCFLLLTQGFRPDEVCPPISFTIVKNEREQDREEVVAFHSVVAEPVEKVLDIEQFSGVITYVENRPEVSLEFTLENPAFTYFLIPSTWKAETEQDFLLTIYTEEDVTITPVSVILSYPYRCMVEGHLAGESAGGSHALSTWRNNDQYRLTFTKPMDLSMTLLRTDVAMQVSGDVVFMAKKHIAINVHVLRNEDSHSSEEVLPLHRVVADVGTYVQHTEVVVNFRVDDVSVPYFVVPSTFNTGEELSYQIIVESTEHVKIERVSQAIVSAGHKMVSSTSKGCILEGVWRGISAGGRSTLPTWRSNPMFIVSSPSAGNATLVMSQDPGKIKPISLRVLENKDPRFCGHPTTEFRECAETIKEEFKYFQAPDVSVSFPVEANKCYIVNPSTNDAGVEGTFQLEMISKCAGATLRALSADDEGRRFMCEDEWTKETAGGRTELPTWRCNPQYALVASEACSVYAILGQKDRSNLRPIGLVVASNTTTRFHETILPDFKVVADVRDESFSHFSKTEVSVKFDMEAGKRVIAIPSTYDEGNVGSFILSLVSTAPLRVTRIPPPRCVALEGEWKGPSAGGQRKEPTYLNNPQYRLRVSQPASIVLVLTCHDPASEEAMALHVMRNKDAKKMDRLSGSHALVAKSMMQGSYTYWPMGEVSLELNVDAGPAPYFIIPSRYHPGAEGSFRLCIYGDVESAHLERV